MKLIRETFDNIEHYFNTINTRTINRVFAPRSSHPASNDSDYDFTYTHSYAEAEDIARRGYKEGLDKLQAANTKSRHLQSASKPLPMNGIVGYAPHVPNAIAGVPLSMINKQETEQKAKVISILYYMGGSCNVDAYEFVKAGKNIMNVVYSLELQGYRVALYVLTTFCKNSEYAINTVQVKHWRQPSNPLKIAYPLIHPSYFRRHGFRWLETQPNLTDDGFIYGYGKPLDKMQGNNPNARRTWLKEQGLLQAGWYYTERIEARKAEASELIKLMGIHDGTEAKAPKKNKPVIGVDLGSSDGDGFRIPEMPRKPYEPQPIPPRAMGARFEDMGLPRIPVPERDDLPAFTPADLRLTAEELYRKRRRN